MSYPKAAREPPWRRYVYHHWFAFLETRRVRALIAVIDRPVYLPLRKDEFDLIEREFRLRQQYWATVLLGKECEIVNRYGSSIRFETECIEQRKNDSAVFYLHGRVLRDGTVDEHRTRYYVDKDTLVFFKETEVKHARR